jgi:hypothetical protein
MNESKSIAIKKNISDRELTPDSLWQHINGNTYRIIGVGLNGRSTGLVYNLFDRYVRHGCFQNAHTSVSIEVFDYQGSIVYGGVKNLGELVFYSGDSGRWCRTVESFLSKKSDDYRFVKLVKQCSACGTTDFEQSSWDIGNSIFCQECWEDGEIVEQCLASSREVV